MGGYLVYHSPPFPLSSLFCCCRSIRAKKKGDENFDLSLSSDNGHLVDLGSDFSFLSLPLDVPAVVQ